MVMMLTTAVIAGVGLAIRCRRLRAELATSEAARERKDREARVLRNLIVSRPAEPS